MTKDFQPLLAATCENIASLRYPVLASPKLDGIRCVKVQGLALTRKLKPVPNAFVRRWIEANLPDGIDGELMLRDHRAPFNDVSSAIMSRDGEPDFTFHAFDLLVHAGLLLPLQDVRFDERVRRLQDELSFRVDTVPLGQPTVALRCVVVPQTKVENEAEMQAMVDYHLSLGYEGTMVRDPAGRYKFGRSTVKEGILLKVKPWHDEEATVIGVVEQQHNENEKVRDERGYAKRSSAKAGKVAAGKLGTLVCLTEDGVRFEIGTGFTDQQRTDLWRNYLRESNPGSLVVNARDIVGREVKFKHLGRTRDNVPRGPVFLGFRED